MTAAAHEVVDHSAAPGWDLSRVRYLNHQGGADESESTHPARILRALEPDSSSGESWPGCSRDGMWISRIAHNAAESALESSRPGRGSADQLEVAKGIVEEGIRAALLSVNRDQAGSLVTMENVRERIANAVRKKIRLPELLRALWTAYTAVAELVLKDLDEGSETTGAARLGHERMQALTTRMREVLDWVANAFAEEQGRCETLKGSQHCTILRVLEGGHEVDQADVRRTLGVDLGDHLMSLVVWASPEALVSREKLLHFAQKVARRLGGSAPLTVPASPQEVWSWVGWKELQEAHQLRDLGERLVPPPGVYVSTGPVQSGLTGFRRSHQLAKAGQRLLEAGLVPARSRSWLCEHSDVAVLSMFIENVDHARWFTDATLGALNAADPWCTILRETLRVYLALDRHREDAAKALYISRNTVGYRVSKAIQLIGRPLAENVINIRLALDVSRMLHAGLVGPWSSVSSSSGSDTA
ncbi:MAG TPA: helix-turn-helix domain-containing protein [Kineosporiaceae bacterium]